MYHCGKWCPQWGRVSTCGEGYMGSLCTSFSMLLWFKTSVPQNILKQQVPPNQRTKRTCNPVSVTFWWTQGGPHSRAGVQPECMAGICSEQWGRTERTGCEVVWIAPLSAQKVTMKPSPRVCGTWCLLLASLGSSTCLCFFLLWLF